MNNYDKYINARNLSWKILLDFNLYSFPLDIKSLCSTLDISVLEIDKLDNNKYSMSAILDNQKYILYVPYSKEVDRFTIAHELGHILLNHLNNNLSDYLEEQANIFASRLLCPLCIIKHYSFTQASQLMDYFGISNDFAQIRLKRFNLISDRNKFFSSPLEYNYYCNFCKFNNISPCF